MLFRSSLSCYLSLSLSHTHARSHTLIYFVLLSSRIIRTKVQQPHISPYSSTLSYPATHIPHIPQRNTPAWATGQSDTSCRSLCECVCLFILTVPAKNLCFHLFLSDSFSLSLRKPLLSPVTFIFSARFKSFSAAKEGCFPATLPGV